MLHLFERRRTLNQKEKDLANKVFKGSISFDNVYIGNETGIGGVPWTQNKYVDEIVGDYYILHMGLTAYADATTTAQISTEYKRKTCDTFIHELVHVWQGQHSTYSFTYQFSSAYSQFKAIVTLQGRNAAYKYTAGESWDSYNVEQQAKIVEHWFQNGLSESDPLFKYIKDNIRK